MLKEQVNLFGSRRRIILQHRSGQWTAYHVGSVAVVPGVAQGQDAGLRIDDPLTLKRVVHPPPHGSDKPIVIYEVVDPET